LPTRFSDEFLDANVLANGGDKKQGSQYLASEAMEQVDSSDDEEFEDEQGFNSDEEAEMLEKLREIERQGHMEAQSSATALTYDEIVVQDEAGCCHSIPSSAFEQLDSDDEDVHEAKRRKTEQSRIRTTFSNAAIFLTDDELSEGYDMRQSEVALTRGNSLIRAEYQYLRGKRLLS
jgi:hypothetical protein